MKIGIAASREKAAGRLKEPLSMNSLRLLLGAPG